MTEDAFHRFYGTEPTEEELHAELRSVSLTSTPEFRIVIFKLYDRWWIVIYEWTGRYVGGYVQDTWRDALARGWEWLRNPIESEFPRIP